jgi:hypothetical protein
LANRAQEIYLEFDSGEGFARPKRASEGDAHSGIGNVAENATVKSAHRIEVLRAGLQSNYGTAIAGFGHLKADQITDRGAALHHALK